MQHLLEGYSRFRSEVYPKRASLFQKLAHGQKPDVLFITCSDSRVMPEMFLQAEPGELFVIRNAGNLVPSHNSVHGGVSASVEYAVRALKVNNIVVCGHSGCGAMREILEQKHIKELPLVQSWLQLAGPSSLWLRSLLESSAHSPEEKLRLLTEANVITQLTHLAQHPAIIAERETRPVELHGWVYDIPSSEIRNFNTATGKFEPLQVHAEASNRKIA